MDTGTGGCDVNIEKNWFHAQLSVATGVGLEHR